ncbi:hypothetical protein DFH07DRAFT_951975 [Mycena maculata]|uniref:DUF6534 domain-containing protein n=1 Tax=Mycena maculata TaxID=230809 RepID=A0AAD7NUW5_9AGAR|nr:hypothetical protein DFH07DRAFT_951975 [Mycena maculata]
MVNTDLYYQAFPNDRRFTKCLVYTVYTLLLVQVIMTCIDDFNIFAIDFGDFVTLTKMHLAWFTVPVITSIVSLIVQSFYAFRLYNFCQSWIIPILIVVASLGVSVAGFVTGAFCLEAGYLTAINTRKLSISIGVWLSGSALIDVTIAVSMTYYLMRKDTCFWQTRALISKLIRLTIETGSLTALVSLATLILLYGFPGKDYYSVPANLIPALYANTMLAVLNSRLQVGARPGPFTMDDIMSIPALFHSNGTNSAATPQPAPIVSIHRDVFSSSDMDGPMEMKRVSDGASA